MKKIIVIVLLAISVAFIYFAKIVDSHKYIPCYVCEGTGEEIAEKSCTECKGEGTVECKFFENYEETLFWGNTAMATYFCVGGRLDGSGHRDGEQCPRCYGTALQNCETCYGAGTIDTLRYCSHCNGDRDIKKDIKITLAEDLQNNDYYTDAISSFFNPNKKRLVVLDASPFGQEELSIAITKKVKELNSNEKIEIVLLRDIEERLGAIHRVEKVNEIDADLLITINVREYLEDIERVLDIYISKHNPKYEESKILAKALRDSIPSELRNGGVQEYGTQITMLSNCPAVLLEFSLTKKYEDRAFIESEKGHAQIAEMILSNL